MIDFRDALNTKFDQAEVIEIIQSQDQEKKLKLALQIIFDLTIAFDLGWAILRTIDIRTLIDEKFIEDFLFQTPADFPIIRIVKFLDFVVTQNSDTLNMAIQKHLAVYAQQKPVENQLASTIGELMQFIEVLEKHSGTQFNSCIYTVLFRQMARTMLPRESNQLSQARSHIMRITEFFKGLQLTNEERQSILQPVFTHIISPFEPQPFVALGLLVVPDEMINQAIEWFFIFVKWNRGNSLREAIVVALNRLIFWQRSLNDLQLDLWITRTLTMLSQNGYQDVVDEISASSLLPAFLTLVIPLYQTKILNVVQSLLDNSKNTKEIFDIIQMRCVSMLKKLEDTKSDIFEPLMELICETLCTINQTDLRYRELIQFLEARNRSPSKYISKRSIGPSFAGYLVNNDRVGLENLGNTCYLNSILQALFMTKQFCREILMTRQLDNRSVQKLQELFALMLFSPRPVQNPRTVIDYIRPSDFLPGVQHDSSEFLGSLLDSLHEIEKKNMYEDNRIENEDSKPKTVEGEKIAEVKVKLEEDWDIEETTNNDDGSNSTSSSCSNQNCSSDSGIQSMEIDVVDSKAEEVTETSITKDKIVDNTRNLYQTYVQRIFGGKISTRYLCSSCNGNSINIDSFRDLQLSFPEKNEDEGGIGDTQYNVQQLLEFYFTTEELTLVGDNQYHCDNCKILCNGIRCTEILEPPRNLILTLKHFRYDSRHHTRSKLLYKVFHDEYITVNVKENFASNYTRNVEYMLYAAVIHSGTSLDSGHYYTIAREAENKWFKFNDSYVTKSSLDELRSLISPNTPYILFYQRLSNASSTIVNPESASTSSMQSPSEDSFPLYEELSHHLIQLIQRDKIDYERSTPQQSIRNTTYGPDNNDRGSSGSSGFNMDCPRYIY